MQLPTEISFSIEKDTYLPADPTIGRGVAELFGPECAGTIRLRWPTSHELCLKIPTSVTSALQQFGAKDPASVPGPTYLFALAIAFFETLAIEKPPWLSDTAPFHPKMHAGIIRAYDTAMEELAGKGESSVGSGAPSSPPS